MGSRHIVIEVKVLREEPGDNGVTVPDEAVDGHTFSYSYEADEYDDEDIQYEVDEFVAAIRRMGNG